MVSGLKDEWGLLGFLSSIVSVNVPFLCLELTFV